MAGAATTATDIANIALGLLGASLISDITGAEQNAKRCQAAYYPAKRAVLRLHPWKCARRRAKLPASAEAPAFGWERKFQLPSDPLCLRVLSTDCEDEFPWTVEGNYILTNAPAPLAVSFIAEIDESEMDAGLVQVIAARLARDVAYAITKSGAAQDRAKDNYIRELADARSESAMEERAPDMTGFSLIDVRV